jgi:hypothetical protein
MKRKETSVTLTNSPIKKPTSATKEVENAAGRLIHENVFWHTCGITSRHTKSGHPETGSGAAIEWQGRFFILTANHVISGFTDSDLEFVFRPAGTLAESDWWQSQTTGPVLLTPARKIPFIRRYASDKFDLAALEVHETMVEGHLRFYKLRAENKIIRPIINTLCAIGVPFDSYEQLAPGAVTFRPYALWGNYVPGGSKWKHQIDTRTHLLMEFPPAKNGREPHGFSGAGAWYHDPTIKPSHIWVPSLIFAGIITHYFRKSQVLQICRVEKVVSFLRTLR